MRSRRIAGIALLALASGVRQLDAQGSGAVHGVIRDGSGAVVASARVTLTNVATGLSRSVATREDGEYTFVPVGVGEYRVEVEVQGFKKAVQSGITVRADERSRVDLALEVGSPNQTVEVTGQAVLVESTTATLSTLVDSERIKQLPLNGRNLLDLQRLLPGVTGNTGETGAENAGFSVNGARGTMSNYTMDGGNAVDGFTNTAHAMPHPDAVQEFSVVSFAMSAEYGRGAGGQINVVTKSGTNALHGSAWEFLRNDKLNARRFFSPSREILRQNQYGAALGGPLRIPKLYNGKDRTFFFFSFQSTPQRFHSTRTINYLMSDLERQGDFSRSPRVPADPNTRAAFPDGRIPASRVDPAARRIVDELLPRNPGGAGGVFRFNFPQERDLNQYLGRLDHSVTSRNRLTARFFWHENDEINIGGLPQFLNFIGFPTRNITLEDTHVASPTMTNTFRFTWSQVTEKSGQLSGLSYDQLGVKIFVPEVNGQKFMVLNTQDFSISGRRPSAEDRQLREFGDTFNWIRGRHQMRMGADVRRIRFDLPLGAGAGGSFAFGNNFTSVASGDFLLGLPLSFSQTAPQFQAGRGWEQDFFFQDDIRLSSRITLNAGLRWEPRSPPTEVNGNLVSFVPGQKSARFVNAPSGLVFPGDAGVPKGGFHRDLNNFAPRIGFAWDLFGNGKTSLRGGYGIFYDNLRWAGWQIQSAVEPFIRNVAINAPGSFQDPYGASRTPNPFPFDPASVKRDYLFSPRIANYHWDPNFKVGYMQQWSLTLERRLPATSMLRLAYVGNKGTSLWSSRDINWALFGPGATIANTDARRPIPGFTLMDRSESNGTSNYNALQVTFDKRYSYGFTVLTSYSWQQALDTISRGRAALSQPWPMNLRLNRGRANFAVDHVFVSSFVWDIPFLAGRRDLLGKIAGGWQMNGIASLRSGIPFDVVPGRPTSLSGTGGERADLVGNPFLDSGRPVQARLDQYFNRSAFAVAADGSWGNLGRNVMEGPGSINFDIVFGKRFRVIENHSIELRAELFNATNTPTFSNPVNNVTNANFGRILNSGAGRVVQLGLKYAF
jgi:hypothetical protein